METYLRAFINFEQNNWVKLLPMAEFAYNYVRNTNFGHILFKLNCGYHPRVFHKKDFYSGSKSELAKELSTKLKELMTMYQENFHHA